MQSSIDNTEISSMPLAVFNGRIIVINTEEEAIKAIEYLKTFNIVGIDTETKPSFKKKTNQ